MTRENIRGSRVILGLPDEAAIDDPAIRKAVANYSRLVGEFRQAGHRMGELEERRTTAIAADRQALADALRTGKDDPGDAHLEAVDAELRQARRAWEALGVAVDDADAELVRVMDDRRAEWLAKRTRDLERARAGYRRAIEELAKARDVVTRELSLLAWATTGPERSFSTGIPPVRRLIGPNGSPLAWAAVVAALEDDLVPSSEPGPLFVANPPMPRPAIVAGDPA